MSLPARPPCRRSRGRGLGNETDTAQARPQHSPACTRAHRAHPDGCTEAVLAAENISADALIELVRSGLAIARSERIDEEEGVQEVTRVRIRGGDAGAGGTFVVAEVGWRRESMTQRSP
jgi:hypothetical protein